MKLHAPVTTSYTNPRIGNQAGRRLAMWSECERMLAETAIMLRQLSKQPQQYSYYTCYKTKTFTDFIFYSISIRPSYAGRCCRVYKVSEFIGIRK